MIRKFVLKGFDLLIYLIPRVLWRVVLVAKHIENSNESRAYLLRIKRERDWYKNNGDKNELIDYELNSDSIVWDVGGYVGDSVSSLHNKFGCEVHVFEPVHEYFLRCQNRFKYNPKIIMHKIGLGNVDAEVRICIDEGASSMCLQSNDLDYEVVQIRQISKYMLEQKCTKIDLMTINIEGAEYELFEDLFSSNMISLIENIQVQFHELDDNSKYKRDKIRDSLSKTHCEIYCYPFVWEAWRLK